jgi:hypothetical protein
MEGDRRSATLRELATECVALAERTIDPDARIALLVIAQKWTAMANGGIAGSLPLDDTSQRSK